MLIYLALAFLDSSTPALGIYEYVSSAWMGKRTNDAKSAARNDIDSFEISKEEAPTPKRLLNRLNLTKFKRGSYIFFLLFVE